MECETDGERDIEPSNQAKCKTMKDNAQCWRLIPTNKQHFLRYIKFALHVMSPIPSSGNSFPFQSGYPFVVHVFCLACLFVYSLPLFFLGDWTRAIKERCPLTQSETDRGLRVGVSPEYIDVGFVGFCAVVDMRSLCVLRFFLFYFPLLAPSYISRLVRSWRCCLSTLVLLCSAPRSPLILAWLFCFLYLSLLFSTPCTLAASVLFSLDPTSHFLLVFFCHHKVKKRGTAQSYRVNRSSPLGSLFVFFFLFLVFLHWAACLFVLRWNVLLEKKGSQCEEDCLLFHSTPLRSSSLSLSLPSFFTQHLSLSLSTSISPFTPPLYLFLELQ